MPNIRPEPLPMTGRGPCLLRLPRKLLLQRFTPMRVIPLELKEALRDRSWTLAEQVGDQLFSLCLHAQGQAWVLTYPLLTLNVV